jgi:hypothetical protein
MRPAPTVGIEVAEPVGLQLVGENTKQQVAGEMRRRPPPEPVCHLARRSPRSRPRSRAIVEPANGQLERLLFAAKAMVLAAAQDDAATKIATRRIGPALVFERLWEETGCRAVIAELAGKRKHGFALERSVFLTVLHRLFVSGSDRAADRWREDYAIAGACAVDCGCYQRLLRLQ